MNSLNCAVFLIFLIPITIAVRNQRDCAERSPECGISCDKSPCQSRFSWCVNDTVCGKICISNGHVCNEPEEIENGIIRGGNRWYGAKITYYCEDDYELIGSKDRTCVGDKGWSGKPPYCVRKGLRCEKPPSVENGYADIADGKEEFYVGDSVAYKCHIGFFPIISINNVTSCNLYPDGTLSWTPKINLKCQEKKCDSPDIISNGLYSGNPPYNVGARILYYCKKGYTLQGKGIRTCTENQQWSGTLPVCADISKQCSKPVPIENGYYDGDSYNVGSRITYFCKSGYDLEGMSEIVCKDNQLWSGPAPVCKAVDSYPSRLRIILASVNSGKVTWTPPPNFDEKNDRYILYLNATNGPKHPIPFNLPKGITEFEITGLHKNDEYVIWMVTTRNDKETQITKPIHYIHVVNGDNIPADVVPLDDTVRAKLKENVLLKCSVVGKPTPSITWFKDGKPLAENPRIHLLSKGSLFISDLRNEDEGEYKCRAKNAHGEGEVIYELVFQDDDEIPTLATTPTILRKCPDNANDDRNLYHYEQANQEEISVNSCCLENIENAEISFNHQKINEPVSFVSDGSLIKIRCSNITLFKLEGDNSLTCKNRRWIGQMPKCIALETRNPQGPPVIEYEVSNGNFDIDDDGSLNIAEGSTLKLKCLWRESYGTAKWHLTVKSRMPQIQPPRWNYKKDSFDILISSVSSQHGTRYQCCVSNKQCNNINVNVLSKIMEPTTTISPKPEVNPDLLPPENVKCNSIATQTIQVEWEYNSSKPDAKPQGYKILYWDGEEDENVKITTATRAVLHGLDEDSFYRIQVLGFTKLEDGIKSEPVFCKTDSEVKPPSGKCRFYKTKNVRAIVNGRTVAGSYVDVPTHVTVQSRCLDDTYKLYGSNNLKCINGKWNGSLPVCDPLKERDSFSPPILKYEFIKTEAFIDDDGTLHVEEGGTIKFHCHWYKTEGIPTWEKDGVKSRIIKTTWNAEEDTFDFMLSPIKSYHGGKYTCCTPFKKCNSISIKPVMSAPVSTLPPLPSVCSLPDIPIHGNVTLEKDAHNRGYVKVVYECLEGYALDGNKERICQTNEQWSGEDPRCIVNECEIRNPPKDGFLRYLSGFLLNDRVKDACYEGYYLYGKETATCILKHGKLQWSSPTPLCIEEGKQPPDQISTLGTTTESSAGKCQLPYPKNVRAVVKGSVVNASTFQFDDKSVVKLRCSDITSYLFNGHKVLKCETGEWNGTTPICTKLQSRSKTGIPVFEYDVENGNSFVDDDGYINIHKGATLKLGCQWNQNYGNPNWKSSLSNIYFSPEWNSKKDSYEITPRSLRSGQTIKFTCCTPQKKCNSINVKVLPGDSEENQDSYEITTIKAEETECEKPSNPLNGFTLTYTNYRKGGRIYYGCNENFHHEGENIAVCVLRDGKLQWSSPPPECIQSKDEQSSCELTNPRNLIAVVDDEEVDLQTFVFYDKTTVKLRCKDITSFKFEGDSILKCEDGIWNGTSPECIELILRSRYSAPTINYEVTEGTSHVDDEGALVVTDGSSLKLSCLWFSTYGSIGWKVSSRSGPIKMLNPEWNVRKDSYDLYLTPSTSARDVTYTCFTGYKRENNIRIKVINDDFQQVVQEYERLYK